MTMDSDKDTGADNVDQLIQDLGGCDRFQLVVTLGVCAVKTVSAMSMMLMAFGNYSPGWRCLDGDSAVSGNDSTSDVSTKSPNTTDSCLLYHECNEVEFPPDINTVVTEWQLVCGRAWISSLIISIQMAGVLIGSYLSGYLGDRFGRKTSIYAAVVYHAVVNFIAMFSSSWQMFAVLRFFIGLAVPFMLNIPVVLALEFATFKWRNVIICFPFWPIGCLLFTISAMATEDWRHLHAITAAGSLLCLLPGYWMPESLRWLMVKDKLKKASRVAKQMSILNCAQEQSFERLQQFTNKYKTQTRSDDYSCLHLLRKEIRKVTTVMGIMFTSLSVIYYAISFSVKSMPGSIYINLVIMYSSEFPVVAVSSILPNYLGRKVSITIFLCLCTFCLFGIVGLDLGVEGNVQTIGILLSAILARVMADAAWDVSVTYVEELSPTVIRSTTVAYSSWVARIGGIMAPYLIPNDPDTFFINYLVMAVLGLICCCLIFILPETKGKPLQDTWEVQGLNLNDKL